MANGPDELEDYYTQLSLQASKAAERRRKALQLEKRKEAIRKFISQAFTLWGIIRIENKNENTTDPERSRQDLNL